ncbi:hypothetical protein GCM10027046_14100 [Uliginosibacterium flavum]|uniref:Chalcone isomerase family protein n=1 Tax=Uliginosibacterium flavum TaxID=1396831 RepID=A0ABV2TSV3_9RHOO
MRWPSLLLVLSFGLFGLGSQAAATEVAGVNFADRITLGDSELMLNGAGMRNRLMFKVYAIGLYLPQKSDTVSSALASKGPRRIQIVTLREISGEQLADALIEFLHKNLSKDELRKLDTRIETLRSTMLKFSASPEKTRIQLDYLPDTGTRLIVNNSQHGKDIPGEDFFNALMRVWLGEHVAQESLREALLGRKD